jgi:hypothetical protein
MSGIDSYLDDLFDRLGGTGGAGRRLLLESEDHLRTAASEAMARGSTREEAESSAVESFGSVHDIVKDLRQPITAARVAMTAISAMWVSIGALAMVAGVSYLTFFAGTRGVLFGHSADAICGADSATAAPMSVCGSHSVAPLTIGLVLVTSGGFAILIRVALTRRHLLPRAGGRLVMLGAALFAFLALAVAMDSGNPIVGSPPAWESIHLVVAVALAGVAVIAGSVRAREAIRHHLGLISSAET